MSLLMPELERQLRAVVRARLTDAASAAAGEAGGGRAGTGSARRLRGGRPGSRRLAAGGVVATLGGVAAALAVGAVVLLGGSRHAGATGADRSAQKLVEILGVLRRPQTAADRELRVGFGPGASPPQAKADLALVRLATVTPWGAKVFLVPTRPPDARQLSKLPPRLAATLRRRSAGGETLSMDLLRNCAGANQPAMPCDAGSGGATAAEIQSHGMWLLEGAGRNFAGGSTAVRLLLVVPDGVAKVVYVLPRQSYGPGGTGPIYPHTLTVTAPVHDNIAAVQVNRQCCGGQPPMIWYGADGHVIKRIGDFSAVKRVVRPPKPAPETPLSRAAERDPSTPNPVWAVPASGGPSTNINVYWRLLLSGRDYGFRGSGPSGPGCRGATRLPGGLGGGADDIRGRIFGESIGPWGEPWCVGTYHVSVYVMDFAAGRRHGQRPRPFGSATFTIHR